LRLVTNFRSHIGILNCAAGVLDKMFSMFPHAAKVLPVDEGLFKGPRTSEFLLVQWGGHGGVPAGSESTSHCSLS
jgi:hypothetical protein